MFFDGFIQAKIGRKVFSYTDKAASLRSQANENLGFIPRARHASQTPKDRPPHPLNKSAIFILSVVSSVLGLFSYGAKIHRIIHEGSCFLNLGC